MKIKYERVYYSDVRVVEPSPELRAAAEEQVQYLLPTREHVLTTTNGRAFLRLPLPSSQGWRITYTPEEQ